MKEESKTIFLKSISRKCRRVVAGLLRVALLSVILCIFRPVSFSIDNPVEKLAIFRTDQPYDSKYEISDINKINELVKILNQASYRRAIMLSTEASDLLLAEIRLVHDGKSIADIVVIEKLADNVLVCIRGDGQHLVPYNGQAIASYISNYILL